MSTKPDTSEKGKKSCTKQDLAIAYGLSPGQFRKWCKDAGLNFGRKNYLTPKQVQAIFDEFGAPDNY